MSRAGRRDRCSPYLATLKVTDERGRSGSSYVEITVGNQSPVVDLTTTPAPGQPFAVGQAVSCNVSVSDEAATDCSRVQVFYIVGHDTHGHSQSTTAGCSGTIQTTVPQGHEPGVITAVFVAEHMDRGRFDRPRSGRAPADRIGELVPRVTVARRLPGRRQTQP